MYLIPKPKRITETGDVYLFDGGFSPMENCDFRVVRAAEKMGRLVKSGARIAHGEKGEGYLLRIEKSGISIEGEGPAGAFYGLQTLAMLREEYGEALPTLVIEDVPDFPERGFYHDVTRGKVPTLQMLFRIVDRLASLKINELQLYVEDAYAFSVYDGIIPADRKLNKEEILALDEYCHAHFVELVPSASTFGHLYNLLQSERYKHLCEYENYTPTEAYWIEKMRHHTIDVSNPESIELIGSMIDEYAPLFRSEKFNICCDETFDLCRGKNAGKDAGEEYIKFLLQIIERVKKHGKTVQMWGDIVLKHPNVIPMLPKDTVMLNWNYSAKPNTESCAVFEASGLCQIVCPGTTSWSRFVEWTEVGMSNIANMAKAGRAHGAAGLLNTNWGDFGNPATFYTVPFGIAAGAECGWTSDAGLGEDFRKAVSRIFFYTDKDMYSVFVRASNAEEACTLGRLTMWYSKNFVTGIQASLLDVTKEASEQAIAVCDELQRELDGIPDSLARRDLSLALQAISVLNRMGLRLKGCGAGVPEEELNAFLDALTSAWLRDNKRSELDRMLDFFRTISVCKTEAEVLT